MRGTENRIVDAARQGEGSGAGQRTIPFEDCAGREVEVEQRRVRIVSLIDVGEYAGTTMAAGSIFVSGRLGKRAGAGNRRRSIVISGAVPEILRACRHDCTIRPVFLRCRLRRLPDRESPVPRTAMDGEFRHFGGDITPMGKGEIHVYAKLE